MSTRVDDYSASCLKPCCGDGRPSSFQRHLMVSQDNDVEATLVEGMKNLSFDQLQREQEDFHGVADVNKDDPKRIDELLKALDEHLNRIKPGTLYEKAEAMDRDYVSIRDFRMLFLKGNRYDAKAAAEQMIRFFKVKHNLFGDEYLVRDITTQDLVEDDVKSIMAGGVQLSRVPDSSGRPISFGFPGIRADVPLKNGLRFIFFYGMDIVNSVEDNSKGFVMVSYQIGHYRDTKYNDGHTETMELALALPINIAGYHFCFSDRAHCIIAHTAVSLMPPSLRAKTKIHYGSHFECQYLLSMYGIPREALPFQHPTNELDLNWQKYWFQQCREKEQKKLRELNGSSSPPSVDDPNTNKHIKFLSSLWQGENPMDDDVLCVGRRVNGRGNERYMALAVQHFEEYDRASPKERRDIADYIMSEIHATGGRFLKLDTSPTGGWTEVPANEMRHKIGQTFRNLRYRKGGPQGDNNNSATPARAASSYASTTAMIVDKYNPQDVLFGNLKNHVGNKRLRELVQKVAVEYDAANRGEKLRMAHQLMETVKQEGGRFLKPLDDGRWEFVSDKEAVRKVGAHFRNFRRKQWR